MMPVSTIEAASKPASGLVEAEAGNVAAVGQARQPALPLLLGAEARQELAGAEQLGTITVTAAAIERVDLAHPLPNGHQRSSPQAPSG